MLYNCKCSFFEVSAELNAYCIGTGRPAGGHEKRAPDIKHSAPGKWHLQLISEELIRTTQINKYHWEFWHLGVHCRIRSCPVTLWRRRKAGTTNLISIPWRQKLCLHQNLFRWPTADINDQYKRSRRPESALNQRPFYPPYKGQYNAPKKGRRYRRRRPTSWPQP